MDQDFEISVFKHPLYTENPNTGHMYTDDSRITLEYETGNMYTGQVKDRYSDGSGFQMSGIQILTVSNGKIHLKCIV